PARGPGARRGVDRRAARVLVEAGGRARCTAHERLTVESAGEVVVERVLPARPPVVFREWTHAEAFAEWMCPHPPRATSVELEPRVGGRLRIGIAEGALEYVVSREYVEVVPPSRLAFTWRCSNWDDPELSSLVTVTIAPHGDNRSLMTIRHALL